MEYKIIVNMILISDNLNDLKRDQKYIWKLTLIFF